VIGDSTYRRDALRWTSCGLPDGRRQASKPEEADVEGWRQEAERDDEQLMTVMAGQLAASPRSLEEVVSCPAVAAAIRDATGLDLTRIPVRPEDIALRHGGDQT
jgi:hypothetical protein